MTRVLTYDCSASVSVLIVSFVFLVHVVLLSGKTLAARSIVVLRTALVSLIFR